MKRILQGLGVDRILSVKSRKTPKIIFHISSSYAKIWGETKFQLQEFPQSGSKAEDVERMKKEAERKSVILNQFCCGCHF